MKAGKMKEAFKKLIFFVFLILTVFFCVVCSNLGGVRLAHAATSGFVNSSLVLDDLRKDKTFDISQYPADSRDYQIYVMQIAESSSGNLYVYTYQPCMGSRILLATDINMSLSQEATGTDLYSLQLVNFSGVFAKYLVTGLKVSSDTIRYYNITAIYRAWDKDIDVGTGNNNTIDKKAYSVGNIWTATTMRGEVIYDRQQTYVINIINPYVDYLVYVQNMSYPSGGFRPSFGKSGIVDSHYIAFSTDWEIDRLISADVHYYYCSGKGTYNTLFGFDVGNDVEYGDEKSTTVTVKHDDSVVVDRHGFWGNVVHSYSWNKIQTVYDFIEGESYLNDETINNLQGKQWVLRFAETERTQTEIDALVYKHYETTFTKVDKVTILRLEFETDGVVYNLGAVSDTQSGDELPGNTPPPAKKSFWDKLAEFFQNLFTGKAFWWVYLIIAAVVLAILLPILSLIFPVVGTVLKAILKEAWWLIKKLFKGLWWLICLPFRGIAALVRKIRGG